MTAIFLALVCKILLLCYKRPVEMICGLNEIFEKQRTLQTLGCQSAYIIAHNKCQRQIRLNGIYGKGKMILENDLELIKYYAVTFTIKVLHSHLKQILSVSIIYGEI